MAKAFEAGMRLLDSPSHRQAIIDGVEPNWEGMAVLAKAEKEKVRRDVREFALANKVVAEAEIRKVHEARRKPPKKGFVERIVDFFGA
jgi:hypothetical protein